MIHENQFILLGAFKTDWFRGWFFGNIRRKVTVRKPRTLVLVWVPGPFAAKTTSPGQSIVASNQDAKAQVITILILLPRNGTGSSNLGKPKGSGIILSSSQSGDDNGAVVDNTAKTFTVGLSCKADIDVDAVGATGLPVTGVTIELGITVYSVVFWAVGGKVARFSVVFGSDSRLSKEGDEGKNIDKLHCCDCLNGVFSLL